MAVVPKTKVSKSRRDSRKAHNFKAHTESMTECPHCHAVRNSHTVCKNCGFYKGAQRIEVKKDKKKAEAK